MSDDDEAQDFLLRLETDCWDAVDLPLPDGLGIDALRYVRDLVYAIMARAHERYGVLS